MSISNTVIPYHYLVDDFNPSIFISEFETGEPNLKHIIGGDEDILGSAHILSSEGWNIYTLLGETEFIGLRELLTQHIKSLLSQHQDIPINFQLEKYHQHVLTDDIHYAVSSWAMLGEVIAPYYAHIKTKTEEILEHALTTKEIDHKGTKGHFLGFRIVRPGKSDHNPFHRDAWLNYWKDTVNIWIPICGFENGNTLSLLPKTHILDDSEILKTKKGAIINGKAYHVPAAVAINQSFEKINPILKAGEGLIFSPYLLHGNGVNNLEDTTRISIELRFCRMQ